MSAAVRARVGEAGRSIAPSRRSQSRAAAVPKTLPAPLMTAGTPTASSSSRTSAALRWVRTSTATWPGQTVARPRTVPSSARRSICAPELSSRTRSAARSRAMCSRAGALLANPLPVRVTSSRRSTRTRSGAATGAPDSRGARLGAAALTVR